MGLKPLGPVPLSRLRERLAATRAALPAGTPRTDGEGVERVMLFGPKGPLIAQVALLIDGEPYPRKREKIIETLLKDADIDRDGKSTWKEAGDNPRIAFGRFRQT